MRVGIFGGSFNPPHLAHLIVAESMRDAFELHRVLWVPSPKPPHKDAALLASDFHRAEMVRCAVADNPAFEVSKIEFEREGPSFTIDTIRLLKKRSPADDFFLIVGGDSLAEFHTWRDPDGILNEVTLLVYGRPGSSMPARFQNVTNVRHAEMPAIDISSSNIRLRRARNESIRYLVPDSVESYIQEHALYGQ